MLKYRNFKEIIACVVGTGYCIAGLLWGKKGRKDFDPV